MSKCFATKGTIVALELLVLGALTLWYVSPGWFFGDVVRDVDVLAIGNRNGVDWNFDEARIYHSLDELHGDYDQVEIDPQIVDFAREKLVRIDWQAAGYYTDERWRNNREAGPLFGKVGHDLRCGGQLVVFAFSTSTPGGGLWGEKMHAVFEQRIGTNWFVVPKPLAVSYRESHAAEDLIFGLLFVVSCFLIVRTYSSSSSSTSCRDSSCREVSDAPTDGHVKQNDEMIEPTEFLTEEAAQHAEELAETVSSSAR